MYAPSAPLSRSLAALLAVLPAVQAHMSMWHPSMYGFSQSYTPVTPLADLSFGQWWFHGNLGDVPKETMTITPGQNLNIQIACNKDYTTYGRNPSSDACPGDAGSYHAGGKTGTKSGWEGNSESNLLGCALAIAYKSDANQVKPEDFIVMSVQERCVRQRDTPFAIPSNLPACPSGGCTCAWFWAGKNSAMETYMTGFKCDVQGGVATSSYPKPAAPKRNAINGPTQPFYWANDVNNLGFTPQWETKPSYNSAWGWTNGAQTSAFSGIGSGGGGGGGGGGNGGTTAEQSPTTKEENGNNNGGGKTSSWTRTRTRTRQPTGSPTQWQHLAANPTGSPEPSPTVAAEEGGKKKCHRKPRRSRHDRRDVATRLH